MITRIYKIGNNVAIWRGAEIIMLIPCRSLRVEPEESFVCIHDIEVRRTENIPYGDIQDENGVAIGTKQDVIDYLSPFVGFNFGNQTSSNSLNLSLFQKVSTYSDLVVGTTAGQLSYVESSQGTAWLPGVLGGTYYPEGWYIWNGSNWVSDRNAIATELNILSNHLSNFSNPHNVTKSQVGLSNVDNTSDLNKPISNATQTQLTNLSNDDILSGSVVGSDLVITLKGGSIITIDATPFTADVRVTSGVYNSSTKNLDFTLSDSSIISVPVSALLPVVTDSTLSGNGSNIPLKVEISANLNNSLALGTDGKLYCAKKRVFVLASNFASTSTTRANVTGMSFNVVAGKRYSINILGDYQTSALTTGGSLGFILSSGVGTIKGVLIIAIGQAPSNANGYHTNIYAINATSTTAGSFLTSTGVTVINSPHYVKSELVFNCTTSGVFQLQWGSEVAGNSAQLNAGTIMTVELLN